MAAASLLMPLLSQTSESSSGLAGGRSPSKTIRGENSLDILSDLAVSEAEPVVFGTSRLAVGTKVGLAKMERLGQLRLFALCFPESLHNLVEGRKCVSEEA